MRFSAVKMIYLSSPLNAPFASTIVAPRWISSLIKSQIGCGLEHTTLKYLDRFRLSINPSIIKERSASPRKEYSPVSISKTKQPARVMKKSVTSRAFPMLKLVYFFMIIATTSVPPLEAPMLNNTADPIDGSAMANASSRRGWFVSG